MRTKLLAGGRLRDATLLAVLGYAGTRPQEALALEWRHVRERTLLVECALSDGQLKALKNRRQPRTIDLLEPLRDDLDAWRAETDPPPTVPVFPSASGEFWRASDWRNWRKRIYGPTAEAVGLDGARPYDLRHAFASLLIHEGRLSIVEIAEQLGHNPTVCLDTYGHVMRELAGGERISAEAQIVLAREAVADGRSHGAHFRSSDDLTTGPDRAAERARPAPPRRGRVRPTSRGTRASRARRSGTCLRAHLIRCARAAAPGPGGLGCAR